jgi:hypothetical protein
MTRASGRDRLLLMQVEPDPPVEVGEGVAEGADEDGLPPAFAGAEGVETDVGDTEETEGDAAEGEGAAGAEEDPEPAEDPVLEPPEANVATGGPGKVYVKPGL